MIPKTNLKGKRAMRKPMANCAEGAGGEASILARPRGVGAEVGSRKTRAPAQEEANLSVLSMQVPGWPKVRLAVGLHTFQIPKQRDLV